MYVVSSVGWEAVPRLPLERPHFKVCATLTLGLWKRLNRTGESLAAHLSFFLLRREHRCKHRLVILRRDPVLRDRRYD